MDPVIFALNIVALVIIFYLWKRSRDRKKLELIDKTALSIENVGNGGVIHVNLMEDSYEDYDLVITHKNQYKSGDEVWYELIGDNAKAQVAIEYDNENSKNLTIQMEKLQLSDLPINLNDLHEISENGEGSFEFDGNSFHYSDSDTAYFYRNCDQKLEEEFYYWEFKTSDEKYLINCDRWDDGSIDVTYSKSIPESYIKVYSLKEGI